MPLILPSNSISAGGYEVANSLRFNSGSSDYLNRTQSSGNQKTFTISTWVKISSVATSTNHIMSFDRGGSQRAEFRFYQNKINMAWNPTGSTWYEYNTTALYRDSSAWYHIVVAVDTTQGTDTNRLKIYVNGVSVAFSGTLPTLNFDTGWNVNSNVHAIGRYETGASGYFNGYMAEVCFVDGQQLDPTSFGEFDEDTGIWKPISVSGLTFGTNGFYLDFENSGSLGADVSGNGNNFTVNNLTSIDQTTDTPTNNFATLNPLVPIGGTYSNGNLVHAESGASYRSAVSTIGISSGKYYAECEFGRGLGIINSEKGYGLMMSESSRYIGVNTNSVGYYNGALYYNASTQSGTWDSLTNGDILMVALDIDNGYVYFGKNGTWQNSGDPTSGASGTGGFALSNIDTGGTYFIGCSDISSSESKINFGNPPFTISSGNSDGNGYGNFEYAVPSGYYSLNTKNLSEFG